MTIEALQDFTFVSKYANYISEKQRRETWPECVNRSKQMMLRKYPHLHNYINACYGMVLKKKILGSQRVLQFAGPAMEKINARGYNCTASYCDRLRSFQEALYLLLCGCGTGLSVQQHHIDSLPNFTQERRRGITLPKKKFIIPDSIEGWSDAVGVEFSSFFEDPVFPEYYNCEVEYDTSLIEAGHPEGTYLSHGAGKAPGSKPLIRSLMNIRKVLQEALSRGNVRLRPVHAADCLMHASDAALSGGVRRSAMNLVFDVDDEEMINYKVGNWREKNPQRARANISAVLVRNEVSFEQFNRLFQATKQFGEPGSWWCGNRNIIPNPCFELSFFCYLYKLINNIVKRFSGWEFCNLCTVPCHNLESEEDLYNRVEHAGYIGTMQAGFNSFPYLGWVTEEIVKREALLGVSLSGMMAKPSITCDPEIQQQAAKQVLLANEELAPLCGVNLCARGTCVKPDGNSACFIGCVPGHNLEHAPRFFRTIQVNRLEEPYDYFRQYNEVACESPCIWSANGTDDVIRFCIEAKEGSLFKKDLSAVEFLKKVKSTYVNWVTHGKRPDKCVHPSLNNNVSNTVPVRSHEWDDVVRYIYDNKEWFGGIALLPINGDLDYCQAPFCAVHDNDEIHEMYGDGGIAPIGTLLINRATRLFDNLWFAVDTAMGLMESKGVAQENWVLDFKDFADEYFQGDLKQAGYCLKERWNWQLWLKIKNNYKKVDYSQMIEKTDNTKLESEIACAGGACVLSY